MTKFDFFDGTQAERTSRGWELTISRMGIDRLEKTESGSYVDGDGVQVLFKPAPEQRSDNCPGTEDHDLERMGIFRSQTERRRVYVVELVNVPLEDGRVEELMSWTHVLSVTAFRE